MDERNGGWDDLGWGAFEDLGLVRRFLAAGADPNFVFEYEGPILHRAAEHGSAAVVAVLAGRVRDIEASFDGRTALWQAVFAGRPANARILLASGANAWRPMMSGWSPGRLSLAGPTPELFTPVPEGINLSTDEAGAVAEAWRLRGVLPGPHYVGASLCAVAGIDVVEAVRGLAATEFLQDPKSYRPYDDRLSLVVGATDVPGGCLLSQPWGYGASTPGVIKALSKNTVCYGLYANPKSGNQGSIARDGTLENWDLSPGTTAPPVGNAPADEVLRAYLYRGDAAGYACAYAGLRPVDGRALTGQPDVWLRLPQRDYWA
jgi:hypothetical protein